ncbi:MAG: heme-binding protein, partial [Rhodothermales bacterium]|nr:heme-binding protein [Rhodothermales bacterium]
MINSIKRGVLFLALTSILTASVTGQIAQRPTLTLDGAKTVAAAAADEARRNNAGGVIAIVDDGGNLMYLERLDGTFAAGAKVSAGKARTAALFRRPTGFFESLVNNGRTTMVALDDFTPLQGGVPIVVDGQIVGAVGISGANSAKQDEEIALVAAEALASGSADKVSEVTYFESGVVKNAFVKGAALLEVPGYKIHASHRDGPGMAEVHARDTDIIYVLEGTATFVTGGSIVDGKETAAEEIRGTSISGGDTRRLTKG